MKKFLIFLFPLFLFAGFNDFSAFDKFDKQDKQEFNRLKSKAKSCMNSWDFSCARDDLKKMKRYITAKSDNSVINSLWDDLHIKEREKEQYEEAQRRANSSKSVSVGSCDTYNGLTSCDISVNGISGFGTISYKYSYEYKQYYIYGGTGWGDTYYPTENRLYTAGCGSISANGISDALVKTARCKINGHY